MSDTNQSSKPVKVTLHGGPLHGHRVEVSKEDEERREIILPHKEKLFVHYLFVLPTRPGDQPRWIYDDFVDNLEKASKGYT